jgi:hypothetical protein
MNTLPYPPRYVVLCVVLVLLSAGVWCSGIYFPYPLWFAPPLLELTPLCYGVLPLLWLPLAIYLLRRYPYRRITAALIIMCTLIAALYLLAFILTPDLPATTHCEYTPQRIEQEYICRTVDRDGYTRRQYFFDQLDALPLLRLRLLTNFVNPPESMIGN